MVHVAVTIILAGSIAASWVAPPPRRPHPHLVALLLGGALVGYAVALLGLSGGAVACALAVELCCVALWLVRSGADDGPQGSGDDGSDRPPPPRDPDAPDPAAFDWDAFERSRRDRVPT